MLDVPALNPIKIVRCTRPPSSDCFLFTYIHRIGHSVLLSFQVFGLVLHLLLTSAIICIIILVAKNVSLGKALDSTFTYLFQVFLIFFGFAFVCFWLPVKSIATITPFSVHALEFLAAVSLLRTKRMVWT